MPLPALAPALSLHTAEGRRKYLTAAERGRFLAAAAEETPKIRTLCLMLAWSGCRITEVLNLTRADLDCEAGTIAVRCLKKRRGGVVREIPVPAEFLAVLRQVHGAGRPSERLWPIARNTAWRQVKTVMEMASVGATAASPKGLRHGFGVHAIRSGIPLNLLQRWLGHASMSTTAIYADVMGPEEREIATRMW
ncbi:tyrosine-type recombinase/integrase [Methylobacterium bullatum]|uniref:Tyrosine recombinase XerD n=1 Tax=Methylobacterium bullatum TaxID=570505 RepID=A0A679JZR8_9HYPH|nr:Tyrosine recombinase XerD [Methylobacterium bullatum]